MTRFYVAKVIRTNGTRSNAITLFANDEDDARAKVAGSKIGYGAKTIHVADVHPDGQGTFDRWTDDNNGVVEHTDFKFTDDGPISTFEIFQKKQ
ncbi:hypothetical protein FHX10_003391 [Rhizobium sp. BK591]|uniref:hypothetical protein n=1 Tax=Rhizobium sp. BK591 TaxID=2586985 RepID=UPI001620CD1F|nr:hypothetical protein [Rhizobium sp. BK591]MBB3743892.1 hypothetical protein [Rhizobium sp. BK591]